MKLATEDQLDWLLLEHYTSLNTIYYHYNEMSRLHGDVLEVHINEMLRAEDISYTIDNRKLIITITPKL